MNFLTALLLLLMEEEAAFWCLAAIVEDILPGYFTNTMLAGGAVTLSTPQSTRLNTLACFYRRPPPMERHVFLSVEAFS